ncbi:LPXTG_cell wall anchor domain-containing protein [Hexamita inflata]|uniref:LPXTG cell wall anchor domain-containing protein n=1 Tax=Hexamita inflata TaxID=28002 RepID=A0AA86PKV8_9EUKA|nr:LPXTG cell wall anchor domain-containing protein [Hexamita inflata]
MSNQIDESDEYDMQMVLQYQKFVYGGNLIIEKNNNVSSLKFTEKFMISTLLIQNCNIVKIITIPKNITSLMLDKCEQLNVYELVHLTQLKQLSIYGIILTDCRSFQQITNLYILACKGCSLSNISGVCNLCNLTELNLKFNNICVISPIGVLSNLIKLDLSQNQIVCIFALSRLPKIKTIYLSHNQIINTSPLANLNLNVLELDSNFITDFSPINQKRSVSRFEPSQQIPAAQHIRLSNKIHVVEMTNNLYFMPRFKIQTIKIKLFKRNVQEITNETKKKQIKFLMKIQEIYELLNQRTQDQ